MLDGLGMSLFFATLVMGLFFVISVTRGKGGKGNDKK